MRLAHQKRGAPAAEVIRGLMDEAEDALELVLKAMPRHSRDKVRYPKEHMVFLVLQIPDQPEHAPRSHFSRTYALVGYIWLVMLEPKN